MPKTDFLSIADLDRPQLEALLARAAELKSIQKAGGQVQSLRGKTLAMMFEKASTRTRVSFEVGMYQLGGHALMLSSGDLQTSRGESPSDTANVLSRFVDGIMMRTHGHDRLLSYASQASVPVINALTDLLHPCQILADLQTCAEAFGADALRQFTVAWIGDGNNVAHSWINAAALLGFELRLACPEGFDPDPDIVAAARSAGANLKLGRSVMAAVEGAEVVTTDTWASMGQEDEAKARELAFDGFQVDDAVMAAAHKDAIFLHCLPAYRGKEVSASVIDGPQSRIWDEAENRLHAQKAVLEWLMA